jgi:hypothetical protein
MRAVVKILWPELALKLPPRLLPRKVTMALKLRPTGLGSAIDKDRPGSAIDKDRPDYTAAAGMSAASTRAAAVPTVCAGSGRLPSTVR